MTLYAIANIGPLSDGDGRTTTDPVFAMPNIRL
jgi:hypothetical protein